MKYLVPKYLQILYFNSMELIAKQYYVYIVCNRHKNVLYVGCTNNLRKRIYFHKMRFIPGFTKRYNVDRLIYYEIFSTLEKALAREQQIKKYRREKKNQLIQKMNPKWSDLFIEIK